MQELFALNLDNYLGVDHKVCPEAALEFYVVVHERDRLLALDEKSQLLQFVCETGFIGGLEQSGTEVAVNLYGCSNYLRGQIFPERALMWHSLNLAELWASDTK